MLDRAGRWRLPLTTFVFRAITCIFTFTMGLFLNTVCSGFVILLSKVYIGTIHCYFYAHLEVERIVSKSAQCATSEAPPV